jgi:nicotinamidase-related amidase
MRWFLLFALVSAASAADLKLTLRSRVQPFKGSATWDEVRIERRLPVHQTGILICDMWDNHWCQAAAARVNVLARKMAPLIDEARDRGLQVIHSPSDTMAFYTGTPWRERILKIPRVPPPPALDLTDPPLPIDDSDGGCDSDEKSYRAWKRQHPDIRIAGNDVISDQGAEVYSLLKEKGIQNLLVMGVHTNMCVLNRTFAIRQMTRWGVNTVLVRDLTDAMYDPRDRPYVSHDEGTGLVVQHIEKYWCPTVLSEEVRRALREAR